MNGKQILGIVLVLLIGAAIGLYAKFGLETGSEAPPAPTQQSAEAPTEDIRPGSDQVDAILRDVGRSGRQPPKSPETPKSDAPPAAVETTPKAEAPKPKPRRATRARKPKPVEETADTEAAPAGE